MREVDIDEHLGQRLPLDLRFRDPSGATVRLGDYFRDGKPVVLVLGYFRCPMLCDLVLRSTAKAMQRLGWEIGARYRALTVSIDPQDRPAGAALAQTRLLQAVGHVEARAAWPFLVGEEADIRALADRVGFRYVHDPKSDQYAHPACAVVVAPDGRIARYLYGVEFPAGDLGLALIEASQGRIGGIAGRVLLTCFRYDPSTRRYGLLVLGVMKGGAALLLLMVAGLVGFLWLHERTRRRAPRVTGPGSGSGRSR
jgi:protein SCO1/2